MSKKLIYSIIPARSGSKRVPNKNCMYLNGHPLIAYSIKASLKSKIISKTIVSTDSEEIAKISSKYGAEVPFLRPPEISQDNSLDIEFILHALDWFHKHEGRMLDYIVHLRPTTPLRDFILLDKAIIEFLNDHTSTSLRSVHEMSESAYKMFEVENGILKRICDNSGTLDLSNFNHENYTRTYSPNGYIDIISCRYVLENKLIHGDKVKAFITPYVTEIDTIEELNYLEFQLHKDNSLFKKLFE